MTRGNARKRAERALDITRGTVQHGATLRMHPWRDWSAIMCDRMSVVAPAGCIKLRAYTALPGEVGSISHEPELQRLDPTTTAAEAMAEDLGGLLPEWERPFPPP